MVAGDVGLGYTYNVPQTSYGVPTYHGSATSQGYNSALGIGSDNTYKHYTGSISYPTIGQSNFGQSNIGQSAFGQSNIGQSTFGQSNVGQSTFAQSSIGQSSEELNSNFGQNTGYLSQLANTGSVASAVSEAAANSNRNYYQNSFIQPSDYSAFNQYQTSSAQKYQQYYNVIQQPAQVYKHFYVHAAPEEPELPKAQQQIVLPPPQKHYKIIFIKAPSTPAQAPQIIPVPTQNEEKTLVYVLVKKPEEAQNVVLPKVEEKAPAKPEVFFIKYNNKQDSQAVIENIVSDINKGGNIGSSYATVAGSNLGSASSGKVSGLGVSESEFNSGLVSSSSVGSGGSASSTFDAAGSSGSFGSSLNSQNAFAAYDGAASSEGVYDSSGSVVSSTASTIGGYDASAISTSQGIPHESYGPPKFKVL